MRSALVLLGSAARASATVLSAGPGDVVRVAAGVYGERLVFPNGGDAIAGFRSPEAAPGTRPILDGSGLASGAPAIEIPSRSFVRVVGFEIRDFQDAYGIFVSGSGTQIEVRDHRRRAARQRQHRHRHDRRRGARDARRRHRSRARRRRVRGGAARG